MAGHKEGIARGMAQALTYILELHKTSIQVYGRSPSWTPSQWFMNISRGVWQSSLSSGLVFHSYFSVYHAVSQSNTPVAVFASPIASFVTSGIKIPIGNCMRIIQATPKKTPTIIHAGISIAKNRGIAGLYSGYMLSLVEDIIEMDVRIRLYDSIKQYIGGGRASDTTTSLAVGAMAGAVAAAVTTPFDTLRAHIAFQASNSTTKQKSVQILADLCSKRALFRGINMRAANTGIKAALFYAILEAL